MSQAYTLPPDNDAELQRFIGLARAAAGELAFDGEITARLMKGETPFWEITSTARSGAVTRVRLDARTDEQLGSPALLIDMVLPHPLVEGIWAALLRVRLRVRSFFGSKH